MELAHLDEQIHCQENRKIGWKSDLQIFCQLCQKVVNGDKRHVVFLQLAKAKLAKSKGEQRQGGICIHLSFQVEFRLPWLHKSFHNSKALKSPKHHNTSTVNGWKPPIATIDDTKIVYHFGVPRKVRIILSRLFYLVTLKKPDCVHLPYIWVLQ